MSSSTHQPTHPVTTSMGQDVKDDFLMNLKPQRKGSQTHQDLAKLSCTRKHSNEAESTSCGSSTQAESPAIVKTKKTKKLPRKHLSFMAHSDPFLLVCRLPTLQLSQSRFLELQRQFLI